MDLTDVTVLRAFLLIGTLVALGRARPARTTDVPAFLLTVLLWPAVTLRLWAARQRAVWRTPVPHAVLWLHDVEGPGRVRVGRWSRPVHWRHRRVWFLGPLTFLVRPRPTVDAPVLLAPGRVILTPLLCQVQVLWRSNTGMPNRAMF